MSAHNKSLRPAIASVLIATLAAWVPIEAQAQSCPPGYYYASDGYCYPGPPPSYAPPTYDAAPPVSTPPVVTDGLMIGLGMLLGGVLLSGHGGHRGRPEARRPQPWRAPQYRGRSYGHGRR